MSTETPRSRFYALVAGDEENPFKLLEADTKKDLLGKLDGKEKKDIHWLFRGKIRPFTATSKISF